MNTAQRNAIPSPAVTLQIFNLTTNQPEFYSGTEWLGMGSSTMLPPNLIRNSYLNLVNTDGKPAGYSVIGNVQIQTVHPFTKGFEGPYVEIKPTNSAVNVKSATETMLFWFAKYNMGDRMVRGGLSGGLTG
jgi:hypothetical protein